MRQLDFPSGAFIQGFLAACKKIQSEDGNPKFVFTLAKRLLI
jgi:hypothetical protein